MPRKPSRPRRSAVQQRSAVTVDAVLTAAARVLAEDGYRAASTVRIAQVAGVSVGTLYQYFANKDAIVVELIDRYLASTSKLVIDVHDQIQDAPVAEAVRAMVTALVRAEASERALVRVLVEQLPRLDRSVALREAERAVGVIVVTYFERHGDEIRPCDLELAAFILIKSVEACAHDALESNPALFDDPRFIDELTQLALGYLGASNVKTR